MDARSAERSAAADAEAEDEARTRETVTAVDLEDFSASSDDESAESAKMALDAAMMNELLLVCSNLGMLRVENEGAPAVLMRGEDCEEWIHDLQRAIRRDHAKHKLVAKQLGKWKILQKKLLPLLINHQHDWSLVFSILKVLVMLTMKPSPESTNIAQQLLYLREYKHAFLKEGMIPILMTILVEPLSKKGSARNAHDYLNMELILTLVRNLLAIPNEDPRVVTSSTAHMSRLQQDLICTLHEENVFEMILLFAQDIDSSENREWNLLIMEMIDLTLSCSHPKIVAGFQNLAPGAPNVPASARAVSSVAQSQDNLTSKLRNEKILAIPLKAARSHRHSNFGGMLTMKGPTGHTTVMTNFGKIGDEQVPQAKKKPVAQKRTVRRQASSTQIVDVNEIFGGKPTVGESDRTTLAVLSDICNSLLETSYFQLTNSLKGEFRRGSSKLVSSDRLQYFHLVWYLTSFHRFRMQRMRSDYRLQCKLFEKKKREAQLALDTSSEPPREPVKPDFNEKAVLTTLDMFSFNFVLRSIENYATLKNYHGMTISVKLLTEMMTYLSELSNSDDLRFQRIADSLQHKIFYERDFLDRLPVLIKLWSPTIFSLDYVVDVVTLTHIVFKILDAQGSIKVLSRRKAFLQEQKKKKEAENADEEEEESDEDEADKQAQLMIEMQRKEADFDVRRYFQTILSFETIKMYCFLLDHYRSNSAKVNHFIHSFFFRAKHFKIQKDEEWTMQPMLFNIRVLLLFNRILHDPVALQQREMQQFLDFIRGVVQDFFNLADKNPLLFVEALLRQPFASKACLLLQRDYEPLDFMAKSRAEAVALGQQERLDRITEARKQKRDIDTEELDGEAEFDFALAASDFNESTLVARTAKDSAVATGEQDTGQSRGGMTPREKRAKAVERARNWTKVEDRFLKKVYRQYRHLPSVYEVISYEDMFQDRDRTAEQIERRIKLLKLHRRTDDDSDSDYSEGETVHAPTTEQSVGGEEERSKRGRGEIDVDSDPDVAMENLERATKRLRRRLRRARSSSEEEKESDSDDELFRTRVMTRDGEASVPERDSASTSTAQETMTGAASHDDDPNGDHDEIAADESALQQLVPSDIAMDDASGSVLPHDQGMASVDDNGARDVPADAADSIALDEATIPTDTSATGHAQEEMEVQQGEE